MLRRTHAVMLVAVALSFAPQVSATDPDRDFSGKWTLDAASSRLQALGMQIEPVLIVVHQDDAIRCSNNANYKLDGSESRYRVGAESRITAVKWEGAALLINTLVSGAQAHTLTDYSNRDFTIMDRWRLSADHATLTITRQVIRGTDAVEGVLVYRGEAYAAPVPVAAAPAPQLEPRPMLVSPEAQPEPRPMLVRPEARPEPRPMLVRPEARPSSPAELVVPEGTRIALMLRNSVDTKHSKEGDRVYLETVYPVAGNGRMVIPRGSFVNGTVTISKPAGRAKGKGELYIRFDSLTLPNGVTRDFRSRLGSAEGKTVDREEGKVSGERDKGHDARTVATTAGMGASVGGLIGAAGGHAIKGVGVGGAAGAAAGLAGVLLKRGPDATLRQGTTMEMILDRDLRFTPEELR